LPGCLTLHLRSRNRLLARGHEAAAHATHEQRRGAAEREHEEKDEHDELRARAVVDHLAARAAELLELDLVIGADRLPAGDVAEVVAHAVDGRVGELLGRLGGRRLRVDLEHRDGRVGLDVEPVLVRGAHEVARGLLAVGAAGRSAAGTAGVSGVCALIRSAGMWARRAMYSRSGRLAITLPISSARLLIDCSSAVPWRRSSTAVFGVSTRDFGPTRSRCRPDRGVRLGGANPIL